MNVVRSTSLLVLSSLFFACGDPGGKGESFSASGGGSNPSSVSETGPDTPTDGGMGTSEDSTQGTVSGAMSTSTTSSGELTTEGSSGETSATGTATGAATSDASSGSTSPVNEETVPCQIETTKITPVPPDVLFVLDKSGSMSMEKWDHDQNQQTPTVTRWYSLHGVVKSVVTTFDKTVNFGVKLYPKIDATSYIDSGACIVHPGVEVEISPMNAAGVLAGVPNADFPVLGGTPMTTGLKESFTYLKALGPDKQRFALLVADGEISCPGEVFFEALAVVTSAYEAGIPTYVVGIDLGAVAADQLSALAVAGGKPNTNGPDPFYQTKNQLELQAAIQQIVDDTLSCLIDVDPEPSEPELFEVWLGKQQVPAVGDCAKEDGWVWTEKHTQIELCGASCLQLKKSGLIEARYFCEAK